MELGIIPLLPCSIVEFSISENDYTIPFISLRLFTAALRIEISLFYFSSFELSEAICA